jgi:apolipoprotein N-acyltransferase
VAVPWELTDWQSASVPLMIDGTPGDRQPVFPVAQGVVGVAICYDFDAPAVAASLVHSGATVLAAPTMDAMSWGRVEHEHHALLFRLRAVENDRWLLRACSSGRSEVISPRGVPSEEGIDVGKVGHVVLPFAHRDSWTPAYLLSFLGPAAAVGTLVFLLWLGIIGVVGWQCPSITMTSALTRRNLRAAEWSTPPGPHFASLDDSNPQI